MSDVKWIRLTLSMFNDEKIRLIEQMPDADTILMIWIKLLVQAGKVNASGSIFLNENIPYTDEMLATIFDRPISTVRLALETFKQFGMISIDENSVIYINNWEKHQNVEGLEKIREQNRIRQAKFRENKKLETHKPNNDKGNKPSNVTVTLRNATELELEEELDKEIDIKKDHEKDFTAKIKKLLPVFSSIDDFNKLSKTYWDVIRETRKTGKISESVIFNNMDKWKKYDPVVIKYALKTHIDLHAGKKEEYTIGIMRNTSAEEAKDMLNRKPTKQSYFRQPSKEEIVPEWFENRKPKEDKQPSEPVENIEEILNQFKNAKG